jgi:hypothetical protein
MARSAFSSSGEALYPYMGAWASGCRVSTVSGTALIIEWKRGTDTWRQTLVEAGQTHTIQLQGNEDGAMIEAGPGGRFVVNLQNCNPQQLPPSPPTTTTPPTTVPAGTTTTPLVTLNCTGSPCPWGTTTAGYGVVWPASMSATTQRLGYTANAAVYLPAASSEGVTVTIVSGSATVYAGLPSATSHRLLATLPSGGTYTITGLTADEVASVQGSSSFRYTIG